MKHILKIIFLLLISSNAYSQMIMSAAGVEADNVCKPGKIYFLIERRARPLESIEAIQQRLNKQISFAKENPSFKGEPAIQLAVNCKGEIGGAFHIVTKSGNDSLDKALIDFFKTIKKWKAGKINERKAVDSWYMWRLEIKDGNITVLNK